MPETVLVVAAHPDDEVLGCGGTIARHVAEADTVHVIFMADGVGSRNGGVQETLAKREAATEEALAILGISSSHHLNLPDNRMDSVPLLEIVQPLEKLIAGIHPTVVYTHHDGDLNVDHRITNQAVMTACRPLPGNTVREVLAFEIMSATEWNVPGAAPFEPNVFVDIGDFWEKKYAALQAYGIEMRPAPHSRSIAHLDALSLHRGMSVGLMRAECFRMIRKIK